MACSRRRCAAGPTVVVLPFCCQDSAGVLSVTVPVVRSLVSAKDATTSWCAIVAANSRSELVMEPVGLFQETNCAWMSWEKGARQRMGTTVPSGWGRKATPPMPLPEASVAPMQAKAVGTNSRSLVGRLATESKSH